jgi:hypothetical protein
MEQRRILLIIIAVTVVLAVTIGVGLWLFYPRDPGAEDQVADTDGGLEWEPLDYIQGDGSLPGINDSTTNGFTGNDLDDPDADGDFVVTYGVRDEDVTDRGVTGDRLQVDKPGTGFSGAIDRTGRVAETGDAETATGTAAETRTPGATAGPAPATGDSARVAGSTGTAGAESRTTGSAAASGSTAGSTAPRVASGAGESSVAGSAENRTSAQTLSDRAYWIQVISSPNRDTVEQARVRLDEYQLGSRILTKEIGETTYYRLRLGPYPVRTEAEKFLDWVSDIDGFADALIFVDYTTAVLAANPQ